MTKPIFHILFAVLTATFCLAGYAGAQVQDAELRKELLAMGERDQKAREACPTEDKDEQFKCYAKVGESVDKPHTRRLEEIVRTVGVPDAKMVGPDGVRAYFLVLQHSPSLELKKRSHKAMKNAYEAKILSALDYANFTDRLRVALGKLQLYGSDFQFKDGKLVMSRPEDPKNLDARRKKLGLPPLAEAVQMLRDVYKMEVIVPQW